MLKTLTIAAALLLSTAAHADHVWSFRDLDADVTTRIHCHDIYGCTIRTTRTPSNSARVIHVPQDMPRNTSDTWGRGCSSCVDLQRPAASFEAGK